MESEAMPESNEILAGLTRIANEEVLISFLWHAVVALSATALLLGARPRSRTAALALILPLVSVSVMAWRYANPFNGAVFAAIAVVLTWLAIRAPTRVLALRAPWSFAIGSTLIAFGWVYPHFLEGRAAATYLMAAPLGTIPCPTLSLVTGAALLVDGLASRAFRFVLGSVATFYALFGALRLGVWIDLVLLAGALALLAQEMRQLLRPRAKAGAYCAR
jgi:hypothetical protein